MKDSLVSIIVPVYNTNINFLDECFQSILDQTYQNWELLIIDDGSLKEIAQYLDDYSDDSRIRIFHIENSGSSIARNIGIEKATGEYITFIDSDDWVDPDYLSSFISEFDKDTDIIVSSRIFEYPKLSKKTYFFPEDRIYTDQNKGELIKECITGAIGGTWCKVYKRNFLNKNHLKYKENLRRTQDIIFNLYAFNYARKIKYKNFSKYHYRMHNNSITKKYNSKIDQYLYAVSTELSEFVNKNYPNDKDIEQAVYLKNINMLSEIIYFKILNTENKIKVKNKKEQLKEIISFSEFEQAINKIDKSKISIFSRIKIDSIKSNNILILTVLIRIKDYLNRKKYYD